MRITKARSAPVVKLGGFGFVPHGCAGIAFHRISTHFIAVSSHASRGAVGSFCTFARADRVSVTPVSELKAKTRILLGAPEDPGLRVNALRHRRSSAVTGCARLASHARARARPFILL